MGQVISKYNKKSHLDLPCITIATAELKQHIRLYTYDHFLANFKNEINKIGWKVHETSLINLLINLSWHISSISAFVLQ